jgi:hypothetical protein
MVLHRPIETAALIRHWPERILIARGIRTYSILTMGGGFHLPVSASDWGA